MCSHIITAEHNFTVLTIRWQIMNICTSNCETAKLTNAVVRPPTKKNGKLTLLCFFVFCCSRKFSGVSATAVNFVVG